eukprot:9259774-Alexandrium_andersonii.AAC.1
MQAEIHANGAAGAQADQSEDGKKDAQCDGVLTKVAKCSAQLSQALSNEDGRDGLKAMVGQLSETLA